VDRGLEIGDWRLDNYIWLFKHKDSLQRIYNGLVATRWSVGDKKIHIDARNGKLEYLQLASTWYTLYYASIDLQVHGFVLDFLHMNASGVPCLPRPAINIVLQSPVYQVCIQLRVDYS
jgi:hypothetical protein